MAKIYSHSESRAKGSVGMTTYRYVRGNVVQSQKVAPWDPSVDRVGNATRWNLRTATLGLISLFCAIHSDSIKNSFNRVKHGSARNYFTKKNYAALAAALESLAAGYADTKIAPSMQAIEDAIGAYAAQHPNTIYRIKKTGYDIVFLSGNWDDADDPAAPAVVTGMVATLNSNYELTSVEITGSDLNNQLILKLAGAKVDGSLVIAADKASATFTPSSAPVVVGQQTLTAMLGSRILKSVTVEGDQRQYYNLTLLVSPEGSGTVTGAGRYPAGTSVPISASPAADYSFMDWSDGNTNDSRSITLNADTTLTARFGDAG